MGRIEIEDPFWENHPTTTAFSPLTHDQEQELAEENRRWKQEASQEIVTGIHEQVSYVRFLSSSNGKGRSRRKVTREVRLLGLSANGNTRFADIGEDGTKSNADQIADEIFYYLEPGDRFQALIDLLDFLQRNQS